MLIYCSVLLGNFNWVRINLFFRKSKKICNHLLWVSLYNAGWNKE